jgi:hypothetical protein
VGTHQGAGELKVLALRLRGAAQGLSHQAFPQHALYEGKSRRSHRPLAKVVWRKRSQHEMLSAYQLCTMYIMLT